MAASEDNSGRTTVILPEALTLNLDLFCLHKRRGRGEVIREALRDFLQRQDYKPDQIPRVTHSWPTAQNSEVRKRQRRVGHQTA